MSIEAIYDVSTTLVSLLNRQLSEGSNVDVDADIVIASPSDVPEKLSKTAVALYLYSIIENPELKNEARLRVNHTQSRRAPLSLDLYYMLTVYPAINDGVEAQHDHNLDAHRTLSRAMRVFYDNGILDGSVLQGRLPDSGQALRVTLNPITVEDLTRIWSVFPNQSYRPSVCYLVSPVRVDSNDVSSQQRVVQAQQAQFSMVPKSGVN